MAKSTLPAHAYTWMTSEIMQLLKQIKPPHIGKKRATVVKLAYAKANELPLKDVWSQPDVCNETVWYTKWQYVPEMKASFEACYKRILEWSDEQTAAVQAHYRRLRLQAIAKHAATAPDALADVMQDNAQRGSDRISAANALLTWSDPEAAGKAQPPAPAPNADVNLWTLLGQLPDGNIDQTIANLQSVIDDDSDG